MLTEPYLKSVSPSAVDELNHLASMKLKPANQKQVEERAPFEEAIKRILLANMSLADEKKAWLDYINFEIAQEEPVRARLLYERALVSLDLDHQFWLSYINFIQ